MRRFFDPSSPLLLPADLVCTFTGRRPDELALPKRAIVAVNSHDIGLLRRNSRAKLLGSWAPFRHIYRCEGRETILVKSLYGGPNIAALVEELSAFGVGEFCFWGYVGAIGPGLSIGDIVIASGALREEGVSHHYLDDQADTVDSEWARDWSLHSASKPFTSGIVWSCDALYRETSRKIDACRRAGVLGVEMEVASFYAVCRAKGLRGAAFLVVSDLFGERKWTPGFSMPEFERGAQRLCAFLQEHAIV